MATTTNYSWTTPDDTDLVKDGAAAIRTLGSSIDTSVKALSPGTTAGDVDYYTTSTAKARLAIGTAGQVLQVNSGATAPEWATPSSGGMTLISTTTLTGATITLSSIPATYNDLRLIVRNFKPASDGQGLSIRFNGDAGASRYFSKDGYTTASIIAFGSTSAIIGSINDDSVATGLTAIYIPDYTNAVTWKMAQAFSMGVDGNTPTSANLSFRVAGYNQTPAISSITLLPQSGNFTSGTVLLYGVK
jgi:hypothetical protein